MAMIDQPAIIEKFAVCFEACDQLAEFAADHRPDRFDHEAALIVAGTVARSDVTFRCVVKLCRLGYGEQAAMLNRTLFEDMISAHWATRFPKRAARLLVRHDNWARVRWAKLLDKHKVRYELRNPLPQWWGKRRKRLDLLFRRGTWTGRSVPRMVEAARPLWDEPGQKRLQEMHDVWHQGHNIVMHYSARSLSLRIHENADGGYTFDVAPSDFFVGTALGFAFWTYAQTLSLAVGDEQLLDLSKLVAKYNDIIPDPARFPQAVAENDTD